MILDVLKSAITFTTVRGSICLFLLCVMGAQVEGKTEDENISPVQAYFFAGLSIGKISVDYAKYSDEFQTSSEQKKNARRQQLRSELSGLSVIEFRGCPDASENLSKLRVAANATSKDPDGMTYVLLLYIAMADCLRKTPNLLDYFDLGNYTGNLFSLISEPESNDSDSFMLDWLNKLSMISADLRQRDDMPQGALKPLAELYVLSSRDKMDADMRKQIKNNLIRLVAVFSP